jgi:hypothetical protein
MFDMAGPVPVVSLVFGYFIGGVILSRGPNYVNDFFSRRKQAAGA